MFQKEVERTEPAKEAMNQEMNRPSADGCQKQFANHLMLHWAETSFVVNDKEKREL
ncbi:hypothetical protein RCC89_19800 [Cytophagaceae bacterium ABcell3]|nr:hypothetical protein RCC89_19645 [Cytophagaceae bacterium ABcell3]WMJ75382.1 hypothetical protein RCC89_19785 [Cytophagaceae bacterium ABcell3]WMJ75385.1 hypothetical protein RCC89_19800 [Cytophagaceae bacterium ABcell3]